MKNIVKFTQELPKGILTIDSYNPVFQEMEMHEFLDLYIPYTKVFERIIIKNFTTISADMLSRITNQYLHGTEVVFEASARNFNKTYRCPRPTQFYAYQWTPLDLTKPVPKSLAYFEFIYNGKKTTYLDAIKTLNTTKYIPNDIWTALDEYSRQQIDKCREYNKGDYSLAEEWYKSLMKDCMPNKIKVFSPNQKTYYEVMSEIDFDKAIDEVRLKQGQRVLTEQELAFLRKYAPAYGVEIQQFEWKINSRKTEHGYTQEPERVYTNGMSNTDWQRVIYDARNANKGNILPSFVRQGLKHKTCESDKLLRDAYFQLKWIIKHLKDEGLMPGYKRCPHCHKIYRESEGCEECGAIPPIKFINANNMFYSNSAEYEDYESTKSCYEDLMDYED